MPAIAAISGSAQPRFVEAPQPTPPGPGEVLCRTLELGICGTDREILESARPWTPPDSDHLILGHECLARVEEVGSEIDSLAIGDLVVPTVRRAAGRLPYRIDMLTWGEFTERGIVRQHGFSAAWWLDEPKYLYRVPRELAPLAVLTEPLSVAEKGVNEALAIQRGRLGDRVWESPPPRVLVTGLGPIAFGAALAALARGWPTTLCGRDLETSFRARLAAELGAAYLRADAHTFRVDDPERNGFDLIVECTGSDEVLVAAGSALASRGVLVWLGSTRMPEPARLEFARLLRDGILRNHAHVACVNSAPRDFEHALRDLAWFQANRPQTVARLITDRVPPEESLWHYEHRRPQGIKTVVVYGDV
jgi:threonine dehydrogenase-like Zn-dependent dehydrogenase